jgi:hypothetical protein
VDLDAFACGRSRKALLVAGEAGVERFALGAGTADVRPLAGVAHAGRAAGAACAAAADSAFAADDLAACATRAAGAACAAGAARAAFTARAGRAAFTARAAGATGAACAAAPARRRIGAFILGLASERYDERQHAGCFQGYRSSSHRKPP